MTGIKFKFTDTGWHKNRKVAWFAYEIITDEKSFNIEETIEFTSNVKETYESEALLKALHLGLGVSYYKAFFPPVIEHPYEMNDDESKFWNTVYLNGLGEFMYVNGLSSDKLATFKAQGGLTIRSKKQSKYSDSALLGLGGGKDSIVAGELLKEVEIKLASFVMATGEALGQTQAVSEVLGTELKIIKRQIDRQIIEINNLPGAYNGHIPVSLIFGLVGAMQATIDGNKYVIVANESSASLPQTEWHNNTVNHQWSKSLIFEKLFQNYLYENVSKELTYFSAIRPLTSVGVAKIFSNYPDYFEVFTSDNSLFKINPSKRDHPRWSVNSPKSLSSFILLSPWIDQEDLIKIFGKNYLDIQDLNELFISLLGLNDKPVLDCVGTPDELSYSLQLLKVKNIFTNTALMNVASDIGLFNEANLKKVELLDENHSIPKNLAEELITKIKERLY